MSEEGNTKRNVKLILDEYTVNTCSAFSINDRFASCVNTCSVFSMNDRFASCVNICSVFSMNDRFENV